MYASRKMMIAFIACVGCVVLIGNFLLKIMLVDRPHRIRKEFSARVNQFDCANMKQPERSQCETKEAAAIAEAKTSVSIGSMLSEFAKEHERHSKLHRDSLGDYMSNMQTVSQDFVGITALFTGLQFALVSSIYDLKHSIFMFIKFAHVLPHALMSALGQGVNAFYGVWKQVERVHDGICRLPGAPC